MRSTILVLTSCLLLAACSPAPQPDASKMTAKPFFDLKGYFGQQMTDLARKNPSVVKRLRIGEKTEEITPDSIDFKQELKVFADADLNRPAWFDKYTVDSIRNDAGELTHIAYKALATDLKVQQLEIDFAAGTASRIHIVSQLKTAVADSKQDLTYEPSVGYKVVDEQKITMAEPKIYSVEVQWK